MASNSLGKKIVFEGKTKDGLPLIIRYPQMSDLIYTHRYINQLSSEKMFVLIQGEYVSLKKEKEFLRKNIQHIKQKEGILLLAFLDKTLVGISDIQMKKKACSHEGILGISVAKDFRGKGIGSLLLTTLLNEAKEQLSSLKIVTLGVFAINSIAYEMYKKQGFIEFGRLPKGLFYKNSYIDHIYMYKQIREVTNV